MLTILVVPINAVGHVNACAGSLTCLRERGHRIIFLVEAQFTGKLKPLGYEEHTFKYTKKYSDPQKGEEKAQIQNPGEAMAKMLFDSKIIGDFTPLEKAIKCTANFHSDESFDETIQKNDYIKDAIALYEPDLIYFDGFNLLPVINYCGIPWIKNLSCMPIFYLLNYDGEIPASQSGLPSNGNVEEYRKFNEQAHCKVFYSAKHNDHQQHVMGYDRYENDTTCPETQILTVYAYPPELNFEYVKRLDWFNLEVFNKTPKETVELEKLVPNEFLSNTLDGLWSGKLIYISMGSMSSIDLGLMKRLVAVLGKTNHKCIVSKGPRHSEYELPSNMYGDRYLPQTSIIPHVDLVITHGGNNTFTETFAQGKPMIIFPMFADQFDNAQRIVETGFGKRLDSYKFTDLQLIISIDKLLYDEELNDRLKNAAKRIQSNNRHEELADEIEKLVAAVSKENDLD